MKKTVSILVLIVLIGATFSYSALKLAAYKYPSMHKLLAQDYRLRTLFALHYDGDATADYLGGHFQKITIEVDQMQGLDLPETVWEKLAAAVEKVTGKQTEFQISNLSLPYQPSASSSDVATLAKRWRNVYNSSGAATSYVLVLSRSSAEPQLLGSTYQEDGIVLYREALAEFVEDNTDATVPYVVSTALHEFGHQLGLDHNNLPNCLMGESAERKSGIWEGAGQIVQYFCPQELEQIQLNKAAL